MADVSGESECPDYAAMKVADLKKELKAKGLSTAGNKTDLLDRLQLAQQGIEGDVSLTEMESNAVDSEEILDEDDVLADEDALEDEIADIDKVEEGLEAMSTVKRKTDEEPEAAPERKKIVLNRTRPISDVEKDAKADPDAETTAPDLLQSEDVKKDDENKNKNIIKLTSLSAPKESTSTDVLKKRAERFGMTSSTNGSDKKVDDDKLKKRMERFGEVKPSNKTKIVFNSDTVSSVSSLSLEEKKKLRAERFKISQ